MRKKIITFTMLGALALSICACGSDKSVSTNNTTVEAGAEEKSSSNVPEDSNKENETTAQAKGDGETSELAYDFATDSVNKKLYDIKTITQTDLYKVEVLGKNGSNYVMDSEGNTIFKCLTEIDISSDKKYLYTYSNDAIRIYDAKTYEEVTPEGINDDFSTELFFFEGDVICVGDGAYDLTTGECLWSGEMFDVRTMGYRADGLMVCRNQAKDYVVYNYMTGKNLTEGIADEFEKCQINSAGYFCIQVGDMVKVYDKDGEFVNEFAIPEGHINATYIIPGEHFGFYEDTNTPEQITVTDIAGNIVREDVYIRDWDDTYQYYLNDTIRVYGDATNSGNAYFSGILDASGNWIISQSDKIYEKAYWQYGDLYYVRDVNDAYYIYNAKTKATLPLGEDFHSIRYYNTDNKLIEIGSKMYNADTFELVNIEYKEECTYTALTETTFIEYNEDDFKTITVYDVSGKVISTIEVEDESNYVACTGNSIITYVQGEGFKMKMVEEN